MESNTVKISSSLHTLLRFPFSFSPLILLPHLLDILLLWSSFCLLVLFHLLLSFTPPPSLCVLKTCRQESLQREYFISVQLSSPLYIRDRVFPAKLCNSASLSSPEHLVFSLHGSLLVSLVFCPSVVSASKTIPLSLSLYSSSLPICSPVPNTTTFSFPRFLPSSLCVIHWNYNCIIIMSSRLLAAVAATEKRKENKEGERRKDGETSPEQREATVSNIQ